MTCNRVGRSCLESSTVENSSKWHATKLAEVAQSQASLTMSPLTNDSWHVMWDTLYGYQLQDNLPSCIDLLCTYLGNGFWGLMPFLLLGENWVLFFNLWFGVKSGDIATMVVRSDVIGCLRLVCISFSTCIPLLQHTSQRSCAKHYLLYTCKNTSIIH